MKTIARGNIRKILLMVQEIQGLIGKARNNHQNDRDPQGFEKGQEQLQQAFDLCIKITDMYDLIFKRVGDKP
jgi:hypothetical protein